MGIIKVDAVELNQKLREIQAKKEEFFGVFEQTIKRVAEDQRDYVAIGTYKTEVKELSLAILDHMELLFRYYDTHEMIVRNIAGVYETKDTSIAYDISTKGGSK